MQYIKLQVGCLFVVLFTVLNYFREIGIKNKTFSIQSILFDSLQTGIPRQNSKEATDFITLLLNG